MKLPAWFWRVTNRIIGPFLRAFYYVKFRRRIRSAKKTGAAIPVAEMPLKPPEIHTAPFERPKPQPAILLSHDRQAAYYRDSRGTMRRCAIDEASGQVVIVRKRTREERRAMKKLRHRRS